MMVKFWIVAFFSFFICGCSSALKADLTQCLKSDLNAGLALSQFEQTRVLQWIDLAEKSPIGAGESADAILAETNNWRVGYALGGLLAKMGQTSDAESILQRAISLHLEQLKGRAEKIEDFVCDPTDRLVTLYLAKAHEAESKEQDVASVKSFYLAALKTDGESVEAWHAYSDNLEKIGEKNEASAATRKYVTLTSSMRAR